MFSLALHNIRAVTKFLSRNNSIISRIHTFHGPPSKQIHPSYNIFYLPAIARYSINVFTLAYKNNPMNCLENPFIYFLSRLCHQEIFFSTWIWKAGLTNDLERNGQHT